MLSYVIDPTFDKRSILEMVGELLGVNIFTIKPELSVAQVHARDFERCCFPAVECWLQAFRDASFVVTDSYHGTIFSILFNKPFISVGNRVRGLSRFESLLSQFGLLDRLVENKMGITPKLINNQINWDAVNEKRRAIAKEGQEFLKSHLFRD